MSEHVIRPDKDSEGFYTEPVTSNQNTILYTVRGREDFVDQNGCFQINYQPVEEANKRIMCELTPNQIKELSNEEYRECSIQRQMEREKHGDIIYRD